MAGKVSAEEYIDFLVASPRVASGTEAARTQPARANPPAHDAYTRLLHRLEPDTATLWAEAEVLVAPRGGGVLVLDDSVLDKPYAKQMDLVTRQWSGKHGRVVWGIGLVTLLWSDGEALIPCDYRVYDKADGLTKNDHARALLDTAKGRGFAPDMVLFDSWYASLANLKAVRGHGWPWLTQVKANRLVNPDGAGNRRLDACAIAEGGTRVHLQGYGRIVVFRLVSTDGDTEYWATSDLAMGELGRLKYSELAWGIEVYHRGLKQFCGVERAQVRAARAQRNHLTCALRAFLRFEQHRLVTGLSWWAAKAGIIRDAIRAYRAAPTFTLSSTA